MAKPETEFEFFASCVAGLEGLLANELRSFGIKRIRPLKGGVSFFCAGGVPLRACLWSRLASRVSLVLGRVNAGDADLLYAGAYDIAWEDALVPEATFAVHAHGTNGQLRNTHFTELRVKDAIVDRLVAKRQQRPAVDAANPDAAIDVRVHDRRATISLDFAGQPLGQRGYLDAGCSQELALSTTMAAGALAAAGWEELARAGAAFVDPVCGNGVLLAEAAQVACDAAPGLLRQKWGFFGWAGFSEDEWAALVDEADARFEVGLARAAGEGALRARPGDAPDLARVRLVGASASSPAIKQARTHMKNAGLRQAASVELGDASSAGELVQRALKAAANTGQAAAAKRGVLQDADAAGSQTAAPQGEVAAHAPQDAGAAQETAPVCLVASNLDAQTGRAANQRAAQETFLAACLAAPDGSRFAVAGMCDIAASFSQQPQQFTFGADRIETPVAVFTQLPKPPQTIEIPDSQGGAPHTVQVTDANAGQFAARLRKVWKERRKWAKREGVTCYRVYDADLLDYAVAIDVYQGAGQAKGNTYLHIAEYAPPASVDAARARARFNDVLAIAPVVCDVRPDHVFSKTRQHESGGSQYRNAGSRAYVTQVEEGGYLFEVDLAGKLDTGIFLDARTVRNMVAEMVAQQVREKGAASFLNLFAYTGTASVYAAGAGAESTLTVDLSQKYLEWAKRNMEANGFAGAQHVFERADVMPWITQARRSGQRFDCVYVDPPTFSNSKAMGRRTWDVQRDHVELLVGVSRLLTEGGAALFCCNLRSFKPDFENLEKYGVAIEDVSAQSIPHDFERTPKIHKCYKVHRA